MSVGGRYTDTELPPRLFLYVGSCAVAGAARSLLLRYFSVHIGYPSSALGTWPVLEYSMNAKNSS